MFYSVLLQETKGYAPDYGRQVFSRSFKDGTMVCIYEFKPSQDDRLWLEHFPRDMCIRANADGYEIDRAKLEQTCKSLNEIQ